MVHIDKTLPGDKIKLWESNVPEDGQIAGFQPAGRLSSILSDVPECAQLPLVFLYNRQSHFYDATLDHHLASALPSLTGMRQKCLLMGADGPHFLILANVRCRGLENVQASTLKQHVSSAVWQSFEGCGLTASNVLKTYGWGGRESVWNCHVLIVLRLPGQQKKAAVKQQQDPAVIDLTKGHSQKRKARLEPSSTSGAPGKSQTGDQAAGRQPKARKHMWLDAEADTELHTGSQEGPSGNPLASAAGAGRPGSHPKPQEADVPPQPITHPSSSAAGWLDSQVSTFDRGQHERQREAQQPSNSKQVGKRKTDKLDNAGKPPGEYLPRWRRKVSDAVSSHVRKGNEYKLRYILLSVSLAAR